MVVMDRRKILLVLAAVIAALGTLLVFLYVQGADERAKEDIEAVEVLAAVETIEPGETFDDAAAAGKFAPVEVPKDQVLDGAQTNLQGLSGLRATTKIFAGEQITSNKFGGMDTSIQNQNLAIPKGKMAISVNLTDPARVAGFVTPGSEVTLFVTKMDASGNPEYTGTLLQRVTVLGVGTTSTISTTTTTSEGTVSEELPRTLMTLAVNQNEASRITFGSHLGELSFGLLTEDSEVGPGPIVKQPNFFPRANG